jgi:hypothetical protein
MVPKLKSKTGEFVREHRKAREHGGVRYAGYRYNFRYSGEFEALENAG